jgi:RNA polymerase sigma factor (sigma-70 family)
VAANNDFTRLLERARQGDQEAIGLIYEQYTSPVKFVIRRRLRKSQIDSLTTADDAFDSVFRQLLKPGAFDEIQDAEHLQNYLAKAVDHKAIEVLRRMTRGQQQVLTQATTNDDVEDESSAAMLNDLEQREELERIYSFLLPHERLLCTLRRGHYRWDEIAHRLNTTPTAARQVFSRAISRVKQFAQNSGGPRRTPK